MSGLIVNSLRAKYSDRFDATAPGMVARGELRYTEDIVEGLAAVPDAFVRLMKGKIAGKMAVKVAEE